jgi:hypothetical protein
MSRLVAPLCILLAGPVFPAALEELLDAETAARLVREGAVNEVQQKDPRPALVPRNPAVRNLVDTVMETLDPGIVVESLYLYTKPPGANAGSWSEEERTALYNGALALSTLAGIRYFSSSRNRMRVFYEASTVIDPDTKNPRNDPAFGIPPAELVLHARQKDLTFGDNVYQYSYYARSDSLIFVQQNLTTLTYGIIPLVGKNKLRSVVAVIDAGEYLLIYAASMVKAASFPGMGQRVSASFSTRADAVQSWFAGQADKAFRELRP